MLRVASSSLISSAAAVAVIALAIMLGHAAPREVSGQALNTLQGSFEMAVDADADNGNGPCDPIDEEAFVEKGAVYRVAVCVLNPPVAPYAFFIRLVYDGDLNVAPEVENERPSLDDNPDANAGETVFSTPDLGSGWDCTGLTVFPPRGEDENTPGFHDAAMACNTDLRFPDTTLVDGGPLAVITFQAIGEGEDHLQLDPQSHIADEEDVIGRCGLVPAETIPCPVATIHIGAGVAPSTPPPGASPAEASPAGSPEASPDATTDDGLSTEASPEGETLPAGDTAAESDDDGGFPWAAVAGGIGGFVVLVAIAGGLYLWRRSSGPAP